MLFLMLARMARDPYVPDATRRSVQGTARALSRPGPDVGADGPTPAPPRGRAGTAPAATCANDRSVGGTWLFVCFVEIVNFATLRRHIGRLRADRMVVDVDRRLAAALPGASTLIVGRSIVEVCFDGTHFADGEAAAAALRAAVALPFEIGGKRHWLDVAIGAAAAPAGTTEDVRLVEQAEAALERARDDLQHLVLHDLSAGNPAFDRLTLTRELPLAIANGEMFLHYQPKVHVRQQRIASAEALVRWQHPARGLILPGDFITLAEEARQIATLTLWTLDQVIHDQQTLAGDGHELTVFINISGQLLSDAQFVKAACGKVRDGAARIGFEITETAVIRDPACAIANLRIFADQGIVIAIDDYGAGLSSLAYLKQLPARELKIDKMFVLQLTSSSRDPLIVRSTIDLAHALDMEVTAEGVETQAAMALLSVMGCDMIQGYLISRPVAIDAFRRFLHDYALRPVEATRQPIFPRSDTFWKSG